MTSHWKAVLQALFVVFLWGTSWVFVKIGLQDIPPVTFAGLRYFLAFVCLLAVLSFRFSRIQLGRLSIVEWIRFAILGILLYAGTQGAVFVALAYLPAVTVNLLWSFSSVIIAIVGALLLSERPKLLQWAGMLLAVLGAIIYFYPVDIPEDRSIGFFVAVVGVLANAAATILGRDVNRSAKYDPLMVTVISMGVGSILMLVAGLVFEENPTLNLQSWLILLWLALVNTAFAFTLWNHTLRTLTAMESSIINGTMLVWVAIFAVIFLHETVTVKEVLGLVAASFGTLIVQLRMTQPMEQN
jgi:drug/metabolite transporter (DMT)-like permease